MPSIPTEHHHELLDNVLASDLTVTVHIDSKDVRVLFSETTDPRAWPRTSSATSPTASTPT